MRKIDYYLEKIRAYETEKISIGFGNQKVMIKPNHIDLQIAYQIWIELSTRKIGLPIDPEHDVIYEIYKSWYDFFKLSRNHIKEIPIMKIRKNRSTRKIVHFSIDILNAGLRPHLTKWQAKYRRWYLIAVENEEDNHITPQQIQQKYPHYNDLILEMKDVNSKLIDYRKDLEEIAFGKQKKRK